MRCVLRKAFALNSLMAASPFVIANSGDEAVVHVDLTDARSAPERSTKMVSLSIRSCDYGVLQFGEKDVRNRVSLLTEDLNHSAGSDTPIKQVRLMRYNVYFNNSRNARIGVYGSHPFNPSKNIDRDCPREKMEAGWYGADEVSTALPPLIVEIVVKVDEQEYSVRTVYSPDALLPSFKSAAGQAVITAAMHQANQSLSAKIHETAKAE
jgi:hypothetical protein